MDAATIALYERHAAEWTARRGVPRDDLGARFRVAVGAGLVLDAGCGPGRYLEQLGPPVVGMDAAGAVLAIARTHAAAPVLRADLELLPFGAGTFAGAFCRHSYVHLPKERTVAAFVDLARVLRPGGRLLLTMVRGDYEGSARPDDDFRGRWYSCWEPDELRDALRQAGFVQVHVATGFDDDRPSDLRADAVAP